MLIVTDLPRSIAFYRDALGATVEREDPPAMLRLYNTWLVLNTGGGPTSDKPDVTVTPPTDPNTVSSFLNIRVADVNETHKLWSARGATSASTTDPCCRGMTTASVATFGGQPVTENGV